MAGIACAGGAVTGAALAVVVVTGADGVTLAGAGGFASVSAFTSGLGVIVVSILAMGAGGKGAFAAGAGGGFTGVF